MKSPMHGDDAIPTASMSVRRKIVVAVVLTIALYDVVTGSRLLFGSSPHTINGDETFWSRASSPVLAAGGEGSRLVESLFRRLGAFSLHAGISTGVWVVAARKHRGLITALLVTYMCTGIAFFAHDAKWFRGTGYFALKQAFGALWLAALVLHLTDQPKEPPP